MIYFKVGSGQTAVDYSSHITSEDNYNVEKHNISYTWTDGLGGEHEKVYNTIIEGSFDLFFASDNNGSVFNNFLSTLTNNLVDGILPVIVYCKNTNTEESTYINYEVKTKKFAELKPGVMGFIVTIKIKQAAVYNG